ncbi:MAG TPA: GNAT family N-acetyltransferase [Actinoplanes sp.]|nr:GNAT family N-acetyltransferase [Actinoplanes sp.]
MEFSIRPAVTDDVKPLAQLIEDVETYYGASRIEPFEERVANVSEALFSDPPLAYALVAIDDEGIIVGLAAYSYLWPAAGSTHSLFLKELYVARHVRRAGVGASLVSALQDIAASRPGCSRLEWMTDASNEGARAFYRDMGFAESDDKIVYRADASTNFGRA